MEFQWFLMALSVRPGSSLAISAHRLPHFLWADCKMVSSSAVHSPFFTAGSRWLCQLHTSIHKQHKAINTTYTQQ